MQLKRKNQGQGQEEHATLQLQGKTHRKLGTERSPGLQERIAHDRDWQACLVAHLSVFGSHEVLHNTRGNICVYSARAVDSFKHRTDLDFDHQAHKK
jgi:hypothetical protein